MRFPDVEYLWTGALIGASHNADWDRFDVIVDSLEKHGSLGRASRAVAVGTALREHDQAFVDQYLARAQQSLATKGWVDLRTLTTLHALGAQEETFAFIEQASFAHIFDADAQIHPPSPSSRSTSSRGGLLLHRHVGPRWTLR